MQGLQQSFLTAYPVPVPICEMGLAGELRALVCDSTRGADAQELCHQDVTSLCLLRAPTKAFVVRYVFGQQEDHIFAFISVWLLVSSGF